MPRDVSGNATPPVGSTAIPATVIASATQNTLIADLYSIVSDTVSVQGVPPMQAPLKFADGSSSAPGIAWNSQANTGLFKPSGAAIGFTVEAVEAARFTSTKNFLIGTTGDTGERLNVVGASKFTGKQTIVSGGQEITAGDLTVVAGNVGITAGTLTVGGTSAFIGLAQFAAGATGISKAQIGLGNADNTSDVNKPISNAVATAIDALYQLVHPAGRVFYHAGSAAPAGSVQAVGQAVARVGTYARLFAAIGTIYGVGDGSTTFQLPDLRGEFIRALDSGRGLDAGRAIGTVQAGQNLSHTHGVSDPTHAHSVYDPGHVHGGTTDAQGNHNHGFVAPSVSGVGTGSVGVIGRLVDGDVNKATDVSGNHGHNLNIYASGTGIGIYGAGTGVSIQANGGTEGRPRNFALMGCITI